MGDYDGWNFNVNEGYATIAPIVRIYGSCIFVIDFTTQNSLRTLWNRCNERRGEISNRLQQVGAANSCEKWNLQTVLKYKENIISSSTRNISTPKRPDIYQHLKTVNVDTTPRRKRVLYSPTSPGISEESSLQVENNKYSIALDSLSSTFNELNLSKNSQNESNSNVRNSDTSSISSQSDDEHFSGDNLTLVSTNR